MIDRFKQFFEKHLVPAAEQAKKGDEAHLQLATVALLIEMTRADEKVKPEEQEAVLRAIHKTFELSGPETTELIRLAELEADEATCYRQFTALINRHYSKLQKVQVVEMLWEVVYADAEMERYEEHLLRRLSDLLYVPHSDFIRAKLRVQERLGL